MDIKLYITGIFDEHIKHVIAYTLLTKLFTVKPNLLLKMMYVSVKYIFFFSVLQIFSFSIGTEKLLSLFHALHLECKYGMVYIALSQQISEAKLN